MTSQILQPMSKYGLKKARNLFLSGAFSVETAIDFYRNWRDDINFMLGEKWLFPKDNNGKRFILRERVSWRLPKRGDDLYKDNLRDKLSWIESLPNECLFNPRDRSKTIQKSNFLFVTWTTHVVDKFYSNRESHDIWKEDSKVVNRCLTRLRQHYGRIEYWRSNEGTQKGFPAPHGVLLFLDYTWNVKKINGKWRVFGEQYTKLKSIIEGHDSRASPVLGFSDIQGLYNPRLALKHISKYCYGWSGDYHISNRARKMQIQELTYFWLWITRKHTYSSSRRFQLNCQIFLKVLSDSTRGQLGISKVTWVFLQVGSPLQAESWDSEPEIVPWPSPGGSEYG
jgi:hypothetical protein